MQPRGIRITIGRAAVQARFRFLWDEAPQTCAGVVGALPFEGEVLHGTCSGTMAVFFLDREVPPGPENATTCVRVGDLLFTHYRANWRQGHAEAVSEIYWAYDAYARPTVPGLCIPTLASVFARHDCDSRELGAFCESSHRLHREGAAPLRAQVYEA